MPNKSPEIQPPSTRPEIQQPGTSTPDIATPSDPQTQPRTPELPGPDRSPEIPPGSIEGSAYPRSTFTF